MVHLPGVLGVKAVTSGLGAPDMQEPAAGEADAQDTLEVLKAKLELSEVVKREMKSVIRAQHAKIEEYRHELSRLKSVAPLQERAHEREGSESEEEQGRGEVESGQESLVHDESSPGPELHSRVQRHLLEDLRREVGKSRLEQGELETQVRRLRSEVADLRGRNADLKRVSRRYAGMLSQVGAPGLHLFEPLPAGVAQQAASPVGLLTVGVPAPDELARVVSAPETSAERAAASRCGGPASPEQAAPSRHRAAPTSPGGAGVARGVPRAAPTPWRGGGGTARGCLAPERAEGRAGSGRLTRTVRDAMALWHVEGPRSLLHHLLYGAAQVIGSPSAALTLFVADPWLQRAMGAWAGADGEDRGADGGGRQMLHASFYLSGKVAVHGYRRDGQRAEHPRFSDLASLPIQGRGPVLALPLQAGPGRAVLAALQATSTAAPEAEPELAEGAGTATSCNALSLLDSQVLGLQLLCATAAGILDMRRQVECGNATRTRLFGCLEVVAKLHSSASLIEFEQCAKLQMTQFFNVATARISFYSPTSRELLLTATRARRRPDPDSGEQASALAIGRRNITRISVQDGIVGRCVRKRQIFHLDPIMQSPFLSEAADGVEIDGEKGLINMIAGPMVAELSDDSSRVMGVLQLIQKRPQREAEPSGGDAKDAALRRPGCLPFTEEDQGLFLELLRVLGMAAYRTVQVQSRGEEPSIERLMAAS
mmetsp:Transcript_23596/g.74363  ORF Transcript_23596/g.74363 Transcript_23596/m.74363 type:complete len:711 (+) Transcript_23596:135-2267(+)